MNNAELKTALRNGPYAWPGGYPVYFITDNGGVLSYKTVRNNLRLVFGAYPGDGWKVAGHEINWEDGELFDDHTGERIESAYAETESA